MLRITEIAGEGGVVTLRLEGRLVGAWVEDLERLCLYHRDEKNMKVVLDFAGVTFIEKSGVSMLKSLKNEKLEIINCSLFIRSLLGGLTGCGGE